MVFSTMAAEIKWHFPPTMGGVSQGFVDSAKEHFRAGILEHVVREVIQNSLDAKDARYNDRPVIVKMNKIEIGGVWSTPMISNFT